MIRKIGYSNLEIDFINSNEKSTLIISGNTILLPYQEANSYIQLCKEQKLQILGINSFQIERDKIIPIYNESSDDFDEFTIEMSYVESKRFLDTKKNSGFWFEIVT